MDPCNSKSILDWDGSDLTTLLDTGTENHEDEIHVNQRYEDLDHLSLGLIAKNLADGIETRTFSLSLAENIDSLDKKSALTKQLERSLDKNRSELHRVKDELNSRHEARMSSAS